VVCAFIPEVVKMDRFIPYTNYIEYPADEMIRRSRDFREEMERRRTARSFSVRPVPPEVLEDCLRAAGTGPSGANLQPWRFVVVADPRPIHTPPNRRASHWDFFLPRCITRDSRLKTSWCRISGRNRLIKLRSLFECPHPEGRGKDLRDVLFFISSLI
jgi:hypothetical protein